jgi:hypothetical protein
VTRRLKAPFRWYLRSTTRHQRPLIAWGQIGIDVGSPESLMGVMPNAGGLSPLFSAT